MQILTRQLAARDVEQLSRPILASDVNDQLAGVVMNSWSPGIAVARIGGQPLGDAGELVRLLHQAYLSEQPITL